MLQVQADFAEAAKTGDRQYQSSPSANSLDLFMQPRLGFALDGLLDNIRCHRDKADFDDNRTGIASLILLAHHLGLVSEQGIDQCVASGWQDIYRLYQSSMTAIVSYLGNIAGTVAGKGLKHDSFEPLHLVMDNEYGHFYLYISTELRYTQFTLTELDVELGRMVYGCLYWIVRELGFGLLAKDMLDRSVLLDEELEAFLEFRQKYPVLDYGDMAKLVVEADMYPFTEYGYDDEGLIGRFALLACILDNKVESHFGQVPKMDEIRSAVAGWWRSNRECYNDPWVGFIKQAIKAWKWAKGCNGAIVETCEGNMNDMPLDYGHAIGIGLPWEDAVVDASFQGMYEAGEQPMGKIKLHPDAIPKAAGTLVMLAKARGLIRLAEAINYGAENEE